MRCIHGLCLGLIVLMLSACGTGGSTNMISGSSASSNISVSCSAISGVTCISGRFVDDAVSNLHYSCGDSSGTVQAVTDSGGVFSCPKDSGTVDFYLINAAGTVKVDLGTAPVVQTSYTNGLSTPGYMLVTPRTLAGNAASETYDDYELNLTRFLFLFDNSSGAIIGASRLTNVINISATDEESISDLLPPAAAGSAAPTSLQTVLGPNDFALSEANFDTRIQAMVNGLGRTLATQAQASAHLDALLPETRAGLYYSIGGTISTSAVSVAGFYGDNGAEQLFAEPFLLFDRAGRSWGLMIDSLVGCGGPCSNTSNSLLSQPELATTPANYDTTQPFAVISRAGQFRTSFILPSNQGVVQITQGRFNLDLIADTPVNYQSAYGTTTPPPAADLGTFSMSTTGINGKYGMLRDIVAAPTLDPTLWGKQVIPLHLTLTFYDSTPGQPNLLGQLGVVVLPDGNVVTDLNHTCAALNTTTLIDALNVQQYPIGIVDNIFQDSTSAATYLGLTLLTPVNTAITPAIQGVMIGGAGNNAAVRLRLDAQGGASLQYQLFGNNLDQNGNPLPDGSGNPAGWVSVYGQSNALALTAQSQSNPSLLSTAEAATYASGGQVLAQLEACGP